MQKDAFTAGIFRVLKKDGEKSILGHVESKENGPAVSFNPSHHSAATD